MKKYDAIIIGFGKAGKTLAAELGTRGWNVAIIERSAGMYGGTCINIGCIPTKRLVHMSKVTQYRKPSSFEQYAEEFRNAIAGKRELTAFLRKKNFDNLDSKDTVTVYTGIASFRSPHEIEVKAGNETLLLDSSIRALPPLFRQSRDWKVIRMFIPVLLSWNWISYRAGW